MNPSEISSGRVEALHCGQKLARFFEEILHLKYQGAIAVAGGYLRDVALGRTPKDVDIFLDGSRMHGMDGAEELASTIANALKGATVGRVIPCYGEWAEDITCVVKVDLNPAQLPVDIWPKGCEIPSDIDLVVLLPEATAKVGYKPRLVNDAYNQELFLKAVLARVDLRLNSLGATPAFTHASPQWDLDAYNSRLVIQKARSDGTPRIAKRLARLTEGKFRGWSTYRELEDGTLAPLPLGVDAQ